MNEHADATSVSNDASNEPTDETEWELIRQHEEPLLSVENLHVRFDTEEGAVQAVDGVSLEIQAGEIVGLVGESGCGKSVTSLSLMDLVESPGTIQEGSIQFKGDELLEMSDEEIRSVRGDEISMVFQEPSSALNPVFDVGWQVGEPLRVHRGLSESASRQRAVELMTRVGIPSPEERVDDYPHQFSGGMKQRAMISMALANEPDLLIADEPTTALDVTIEAQILDLIEELNEEIGMAVLLITHDLGVVAEICDRVAVMYAGRIVEYGDVEDIFLDPRHPYTKGLVSCVPDPTTSEKDLKPIEGQVPDLANTPDGCNFAPRCPYATKECTVDDPRLRDVADDHFSACLWEDPQ
ncbi:ABC transporter ATP-binding protein [Halorussus salinisoli]|uniref:ABC transporter ATP-binding protein n=1 Tax=Halorussus salinisoli TaxID=2558242 RepID=UPI0010C1831F|nr:ABC transporter ATP-binding protein [Halorussus salinisoli]